MKTAKEQKGYLVLILATTIILLSFSSMVTFFYSVFDQYRSASNRANQLKARYLARSGLETAVTMLNKIPASYLRRFGVIPATPPIPLGGGSITIFMQEERGKLNLNHLVNQFNDQPNLKSVERFQRLLQNFSLSPELTDGIVDWIDKNNTRMPSGYEEADYLAMTPPRRIKNSWMHSVNELLFIPGFSADLLYKDHRTKAEKEMYSQDFLTEEEKNLVTEDDYILANSISATLAKVNLDERTINLNSAGYHALLALSPYITPTIAKAILRERQKKGGYFSSLEQVSSIPQLNLPVKEGITLYKWIESEISIKDKLFLIEAHSLYRNHTAMVKGLYDKQGNRLTMYME